MTFDINWIRSVLPDHSLTRAFRDSHHVIVLPLNVFSTYQKGKETSDVLIEHLQSYFPDVDSCFIDSSTMLDVSMESWLSSCFFLTLDLYGSDDTINEHVALWIPKEYSKAYVDLKLQFA